MIFNSGRCREVLNQHLGVSLGVERPGDDHVRHKLLHLLPGGAGADYLQDHGAPGLRPGPEAHPSQVHITLNWGIVITIVCSDFTERGE